jgi:hypothetical protein
MILGTHSMQYSSFFKEFARQSVSAHGLQTLVFLKTGKTEKQFSTYLCMLVLSDNLVKVGGSSRAFGSWNKAVIESSSVAKNTLYPNSM